MAAVETQATLLAFFDYLFSKDDGYICIAVTRPPARRDTFHEEFFEWPRKRKTMVNFIDKMTPTHNVYFCVNIMKVARRKKENAIPQNLVWADLDSCRPDQVDIPPQCVIQSSPNRYQAIWRMDQKVDPTIAEQYSKRIAYYYADLGADKSGHDLTQLLRVPTTYNFKYQLDDVPVVELISTVEDLLPTDVFESLPLPIDSDENIPELALADDLPTPEAIIYRYQDQLRPTPFAQYYSEEPASDWSKVQWRLINMCLDVGMSNEETFVIAKSAKCNKYGRDGRPDTDLWREVLKAEYQKTNIETLTKDYETLTFPELVTKDEVASLEPTLVDDYMDWATEATDAVPIYHEISCCMLMSMLMSTTLRLQTANAKVYSNLWALILGESTLTRKSTAMDMALDFVYEIDRDLIVASDASAEGLMTALSLRPKMVSIFSRDEVTGFFGAINSKQYLSDMPEIMTKMYDVPKYMPRTLKKDTYVVSEPIFIFFGGGVPDKMMFLAGESYFTSGFMPRFLIVNGEASPSTRRPTVPPGKVGTDKRAALFQTFSALHSMYTDQEVTITLGGGQSMTTTPEINVIFPDELWDRAADMERALLKAAHGSPEENMALPTFSRMFFSILKLTMLFAAARQEPDELKVYAELRDLLNAGFYIQRWGSHAVHFILNAGGTMDEQKLRAVYRTIDRNPGIMRGQVMNRHHLNARDMEQVHDTLVQRQMVQANKRGRGYQYWPLGRERK